MRPTGWPSKAGEFSYTHVRGYHPLVAAVAGTGDVVHSPPAGRQRPLRPGRGQLSDRDVQPGARRGRHRTADAAGRLGLLQPQGRRRLSPAPRCAISITAKLSQRRCKQAIAAIDESAWTPIPYFLDGADVAETTYRPFGTKGRACRLIVRRVRPTPGTQLALFAEFSYHAFITDRPGDTLELEADHRRHAEIENTIRDLKYGVGLNHLPSGRFGANAAWLALNVIAHNLARWSHPHRAAANAHHHRDPSPPLPEPARTTHPLSPTRHPAPAGTLALGRTVRRCAHLLTATSCS